MSERPAKERGGKERGAKERKGTARGAPASAQPAKSGQRERRKGRGARRGSPLAQALARLEQLRPPSAGDLLTVLALAFICLVAGTTFWMYHGTPTPW